ncbi:hypothetical protein UM93_14870 [Psychromicrobium lacuslunae]|uniref:HTH tetR-type domain-containing protein n=1 Tax=Psychromicrobium lacuslunae TaxID=1618207 RepID=A0A0D4C3P4_9MICC|nr:hypothetical protein UM93_14870 [Psychromicrobium lacuslunae]
MSPPARKRPRNRKQTIEAVAAEAFAQSGYHNVSMQDLADVLDISAPALYRHVPNKYALFVRVVFGMVARLFEATEESAKLPHNSRQEAEQALGALIDDFISVIVELRARAGIYRWEGRYLQEADRARLGSDFAALRSRLQIPLANYRADLDEVDRGLMAGAVMAVISSVTVHHTVVAARKLRELLAAACWRILDGDLPAAGTEPAERSVLPVAKKRREQLMTQAIALFHAQGYHETTIEDLALAVRLTPSGVYRHFESKADILRQACSRAAAELEQAATRAVNSSADPGHALAALCDDYVRYSFANYQLAAVYFAEVGNLSETVQRGLRTMQRQHLSVWVELLQGARPELTAKEAMILVHAALSVVQDIGTLLHHRTNAATQRRLTKLLLLTLGVTG